jgi:hypothetical protein
MPLLPVWAFLACSRMNFAFSFTLQSKCTFTRRVPTLSYQHSLNTFPVCLPELLSSTEFENEWSDSLSSHIRLDVFAIDYLPLTSFRWYWGPPQDLYSGCVLFESWVAQYLRLYVIFLNYFRRNHYATLTRPRPFPFKSFPLHLSPALASSVTGSTLC